MPCAVRLGATSPMLVELFERITGEPFTDTPGSYLTSRIRSMGRLLRVVLDTAGDSFNPPLETSKTVSRTGEYATLNRLPRRPCTDISLWRRRVCEAERHQTPQLRPHQLTARQDPHLNLWIRNHQHLVQKDDVAEWEPSIALLILWEVDHGQAWPTTAAQRSGALAGFTKRLSQQASRDDELKLWFLPREAQRPLAPGLTDSHQQFWPVRILRPGPSEPQGWYEEFVSRWRAHLATLAAPLGVAAAPTPSVSSDRRVRQRLDVTVPSQSTAAAKDLSAEHQPATGTRVRAKPLGLAGSAQAPKRQRTMLAWLHRPQHSPTGGQEPDPTSPTSTTTDRQSHTSINALRDTTTMTMPPPAEIPPPPRCVHGRAAAGPPT